MAFDSILQRFEPLFQRLDHLAGGRGSNVTIDAKYLAHPKTKRAFAWVFRLLVFELVLGFGAAVFALVIAANGDAVPIAVWLRTFVVLGMTATLFYFAWRASMGLRWGYQRLRLFAQIFPIITLVLAAIPNLYPDWMITEQIVFSLVMIGVADFLTSDHMREAFRKPQVDAEEETAA
jgi:uncharacterized membrane protein